MAAWHAVRATPLLAARHALPAETPLGMLAASAAQR